MALDKVTAADVKTEWITFPVNVENFVYEKELNEEGKRVRVGTEPKVFGGNEKVDKDGKPVLTKDGKPAKYPKTVRFNLPGYGKDKQDPKIQVSINQGTVKPLSEFWQKALGAEYDKNAEYLKSKGKEMKETKEEYLAKFKQVTLPKNLTRDGEVKHDIEISKRVNGSFEKYYVRPTTLKSYMPHTGFDRKYPNPVKDFMKNAPKEETLEEKQTMDLGAAVKEKEAEKEKAAAKGKGKGKGKA